MCKVEGNLINGSGSKADCGKCSCRTSSAEHVENPAYPNHCKRCRQVMNR